MFGLLGSERLHATSSGTLAMEDVLSAGVRGHPDINAIATRKPHEIEVLLWNYHDEDIPASAAPIELTVSGLPAEARRGVLEQFLIDSDHSNAFTAWKTMGSPKSLSADQHEELQKAGQLQLLRTPEWVSPENRTLHLKFVLPRNGLRLLRFAW